MIGQLQQQGNRTLLPSLPTSVLGAAATTAIARRLTADRRPAFAFHGVSSAAELGAVLAAVRRARPSGAEPPIITFDDGLESAVELGLGPLLQSGLRATLFVNPGVVTGSGVHWWDIARSVPASEATMLCPDLPPSTPLTTFLKTVTDQRRREVLASIRHSVSPRRSVATADQLRRWLDAGMSIGNHTWDHPCLDMCDPDEQRNQIVRAHDWLTDFLGRPPTEFAYPNGDWTPEAEACLVELGYERAYLFDHRLGRRDDPPLRQSRLRIDSDCSPARARAIASGAHSTVFHLVRPGLGKSSGRPPTSNLDTFGSEALVNSYDPQAGLTAAERTLFDTWLPPAPRVLDLGVGTGRTYPALAALASEYVGSDFSLAMVEAATTAHPEGAFQVIDAADLSAFSDGSFEAVVFSYNGLDYLHPYASRSSALHEISRVLAPGGVFIYSSHNPRAIARWPDLHVDSLRAKLKATAIGAIATVRATRSFVLGKAFWVGAGYQVDRIRPLLTYYATKDELRKELVQHGLLPLQLIAGDHPRPHLALATAWTYVAARKPSMSDITFRSVVAGGATPADIALAWDRIASSTDTSFFQTRAWVEAWHEAYGDGQSITYLLAEGDGEIVGLLPLCTAQRMAHSTLAMPLRFTAIAGGGRGGADHLGPVADDLEVGARLISEAMRGTERTTYLENLSPQWGAIAARDGRPIRNTEWYVATRSPSGSFSDRWSAKLKKNNRRRDRQLADLGVTSRWVVPGPGFGDALRELASVHRARWEAASQGGMFDDVRRDLFVRLGDASPVGSGPAVLLLEQGSRTVAALLALRHRDTLSVYKTGWDPEFAKVGLGIALGVEAMGWAEQHGFLKVDYLRGRKGHKVDLGCAPVLDVSVIRPRGAAGLVLEARERASAGGRRPGTPR